MSTAFRPCAVIVLLALVSTTAAPAAAQRDFEPLFDTFNIRVEGSWVDLSTDVRLDSELLGRGASLSFEDDLDLGSRETIPTVAFDWQISRNHKLGFRW